MDESLTKSQDPIDRKFIVTAIIIGTAYTVIITALGFAVGKEAAGVGGVALTALATALFKQFETLRFKHLAEEQSRVIEIPKAKIWYYLLVIFAFIGLEVTIETILLYLLNYAGWLTSLLLYGSFGWLTSVTLTTFSYFLGGLFIGKTSSSITYTPVVIAAFFRNSVAFLMYFTWLPVPWIMLPFSLLYFGAAFFGARLGFRSFQINTESNNSSTR